MPRRRRARLRSCRNRGGAASSNCRPWRRISRCRHGLGPEARLSPSVCPLRQDVANNRVVASSLGGLFFMRPPSGVAQAWSRKSALVTLLAPTPVTPFKVMLSLPSIVTTVLPATTWMETWLAKVLDEQIRTGRRHIASDVEHVLATARIGVKAVDNVVAKAVGELEDVVAGTAVHAVIAAAAMMTSLLPPASIMSSPSTISTPIRRTKIGWRATRS
jgi:hypothetical protein